ncbi:MAG TPA: SusC/RagA family TonB-linked outer membrane protein [Chitinophagaceae bacterium]|nr:SusC/RagA family TonB-linked outer membrane protein [Chitinophagaceae bacterium]
MKRSLLLAWLFMLVMPVMVLAQQRQVTGQVTTENGQPVAAASVLIKGTTTGATADDQGRFSITVPSSNAVLVISAAGFRPQEVRIGRSDNYSVSLKSGDDLSEVIVTAFGIRKEKKALGYSAQDIKADDIAASRQPNLINAMQGRMAGVQINSTGGAPGQGARIIIRGIKSLDPNRNNQPLFVIDGIVMDNSTDVRGATATDAQAALRGMSNRAADINPDDIETISVLKGGAATALYGQAGSNGVVVITTKSAKAGKMRVNLTTSYGIDEVNKFPEVQFAFTQGYVYNPPNKAIYKPDDFFPTWGSTVAEARAIDPTHPAEIFHHYKQGFQQGNQFRTSINISGGNESALLSASLSHFKQKGVIPFSDYKNVAAHLKGQFKLSEKLRVTSSLHFTNSGGYRVNADRYNESLTYWSPRWSVMDYIKPDGTMNTHLPTYTNNNPVYGVAMARFRDDVYRFIGSIGFTYSPLSWLSFDYRGGIDYYNDFRRHAAPGPKNIVGEVRHGDLGLGFVNEYRIGSRLLNSNIIATFNNDWTSKLNTVLRVGNDIRDRKFDQLNATGSELDIPDLLTLNNTKVRNNSQYQEKYRIVSVFGDLTIGWDNFLFLNVTGRNDWSSALAVGNNSFFYPSASLSYVFSDHLPMPNWLSFGKVRASLAEIGKDTDPYRISTYYNSSTITSTGQVIWTREDAKGDASLKPERTTTIEFGTELRFLQNRIGLDFTWYKLNSRDQIIPLFVSPTTGFTQVIINAGELENKGIEIVLNGTPVRKKDFSWDVSVNFSRNRNRVVKLREGLTEITVGSHFGYVGATATMKYVPGYAVGNIYGTSYQRYYGAGVTDDKVTLRRDLPIVIASTGTNRGFPVRDLTQRILGNSQPDWIGGISNTFTYKNISLSFLFDTHQGHDRYNQLGNFMSAFGIAKYTEDRNTSKTFAGVLADGTENKQLVYMGLGLGPDGRDYGQGFYRNVHRGVTENFVEDASWVRLRTLSLGYEIPTKAFTRTFIKGATISFTGNNLLLFTDYSGYDPESSSFDSGSNIDAFSGFTYPATRSYLLTLNVNF